MPLPAPGIRKGFIQNLYVEGFVVCPFLPLCDERKGVYRGHIAQTAFKIRSYASASIFEASKSVSGVSNGVAETIYSFYKKKARGDHTIVTNQPVPYLKLL